MPVSFFGGPSEAGGRKELPVLKGKSSAYRAFAAAHRTLVSTLSTGTAYV
jgi:hypothetical protein